MSGYVELKIRTQKHLTQNFIKGLLDELANVLKIAGHHGSVKCTNTKQEVEFNVEEKAPKLSPVEDKTVNDQDPVE